MIGIIFKMVLAIVFLQILVEIITMPVLIFLCIVTIVWYVARCVH